MRTILLTLTAAALGLPLFGCSKAESYAAPNFNFDALDKVAILEVTGAVRGEAVKNQISDYFALELLKHGFVPVERRQVQTILKEQDFQATDLTSPENVARAGRILNVPAGLIINIPEYSNQIELTAKMINVEDGSIVWVGTASGNTGRWLATIGGAAAGAVLGSQVAGDERVLGAILGGAAGGAGGYVLTPNEAKLVRKMIDKVATTLPYSGPQGQIQGTHQQTVPNTLPAPQPSPAPVDTPAQTPEYQQIR